MSDGKKVYVKGATQISVQQPLSEEWLTAPLRNEEPYTRSVDPNFREWLNPLESRRLGKILKRALVTSMKVMKDTGVSQPDAIITGTGLGCIENTELFLGQLCREGEEMLKPTYFMQSTHNTISSLIAIQGKCHGYNSTYSHKSVSFDSALFDAFVQMKVGDVSNALVTGNDEMTPSYFSILRRTGYIGQPGQVTASEVSVAMMLSVECKDVLCEIVDMRLWSGEQSLEELPHDVDAIMVGVNGNTQNDIFYKPMMEHYAAVPQLQYKHLFGECYTVSGLGVYAAAHLLAKGSVPASMRCDGKDEPVKVNRLLLLNHSDGENYSYVLMERLV